MQTIPAINNIQNQVCTTPKLGFAGVGWIGRSRLDCIARHTNAHVSAVFDPSEVAVNQTKTDFPEVKIASSFNKMLDMDLDGIVIATPSALHEQQTMQALERGMAVFCQKPLARTAAATRKLVEKAQENNVLLGVDFSYRDTIGMQKVKDIIQQGSIGNVFHAHLIFHNAYGPDKAWYYNPELSGGGCIMDLGIHLVDMLFWLFPGLQLANINSQLYTTGKPMQDVGTGIEDFATVQIGFQTGFSAHLSCSWNVSAGQDAVVEATFLGTRGGIRFTNVNGSFYDFQTELYQGTSKEVLIAPPDDWMGRTATVWARQLAENPTFDDRAASYIKVAEVLDKIYSK